MKLATVRRGRATTAVRVDDRGLHDLGVRDVGTLLREPDWRDRAQADDGEIYSPESATYVAPVLNPGKILCVGLNYRAHILEMGRDLPEYPTVFAKFAEAIVGPTDDIQLPPESNAVDWEGELALVVGRPVRRAGAEAAAEAIAGFFVLNDVTARDWQYRTTQWLQGKTFESTTPCGPVLVTPDELAGGVAPALQLTTMVDGEAVQEARTDDLVFGPVELVQYLSSIITLQPGDIIATGTPGGVGQARQPARYLAAGMTLTTRIEGIGQLDNRVVSTTD